MTPAWRFGSTVFLLAGSLAFTLADGQRKPQPLVQPLSSIPKSLAGWTGTDDAALTEPIEASLAATSYLARTYRRGSSAMNLFVAFYAQQRAGESMHSPKFCLGGGGWEMVDSGMVNIPFNGQPIRISNYTLYKGGEHARILYWYQGKNRAVADEYMAKAYLVWDALRYGQTSGSIVRLTIEQGPAALQDGTAFATEIASQVQRCFGGRS
jgi:EpsI family protein